MALAPVVRACRRTLLHLRDPAHLIGHGLEKAHLRVPIGAAFALDEVAEAHRKVIEHVLGKVVLRIR